MGNCVCLGQETFSFQHNVQIGPGTQQAYAMGLVLFHEDGNIPNFPVHFHDIVLIS
jgi:hypothetical protein